MFANDIIVAFLGHVYYILREFMSLTL